MALALTFVFFVALLPDVWSVNHRFLRQPFNATVRVGENALLRCAIKNQQTSIQWTVGGFGLGATLPDPRMSFEGRQSDGEYNLRIENVTLSDDGMYSCQAMPDFERGLAALKSRDAMLNVVVPPKEINIDPEVSGAIDVKFPRRVTVTCTVPDTKPASQIVWAVDGVDHSSPRREVTAGSERKLSTTTSSIVLYPTKENNGSSVECVVSHAGLDAPKSHVATLNVLYPPNRPRISGFQSRPLRSGEELRVNCLASSGNPLAKISWLIGGEIVQTEHYRTETATQSVLRHTLRPSDDGKILVCRVESPALDEPLEDQAKLEVYYPPENISIRVEPKDGTREKGVMTFTCHYSRSNPQALLDWYIDDVKLPLQWSENVGSVPYRIRTFKSEDSSGRIELTLTSVRRVDAELVIKCKATISKIGFRKEVTAHPEVNFPPRNVKVSVISPVTAPITVPRSSEASSADASSDGEYAYKAGDIVLFQCVARGGNPPPELDWSINGRRVAADETVATSAPSKVKTARTDDDTSLNEFTTTGTMEITLQRTHNDASIYCTARHNRYSETVSDVKTLKVAFPPETLSIEQYPSLLIAGNPMSLTCKTSPSYPPAEISWYKYDVELPVHNYVALPPSSGSFGGLAASSRLQLTPGNDDDGASFSCRAEVKVLRKTVTKSCKLHVEYPPVFYSVNGNNTSYNATEGDSFIEIEAVARANPHEMTYSWFHIVPMRNAKGETVLTKNSLTKDRRFVWNPDKGHLRIKQPKRVDGGIYLLRATNARGSNDHNITLNVLYPPIVTGVIGPNHTMEEGQSTKLRCDFRSHPLSPAKVKWTKESPGSGRNNYNVQTFTDHSILILKDLRADDRGIYKCSVENGIDNGDSRKINLQLHHTPVFGETTPRKVAVSSVGSDGRLYPNAALPCIVHSSPPALITWGKGNDTINAADDGRYSILRKVIDFETISSTLRVNKISLKDASEKEGVLAEFLCKASNTLGESWKRIEVVLHGPPDAPSGLQVFNVSTTSVFLTWKKGFNGGARQRFVIQYKQSSDNDFGDDAEVSSDNDFGDDAEVTSHTSSGTVMNLEGDREYVFRVVSKNDYGKSAPSGVVAARTRSFAKQGSASVFGINRGHIIVIAIAFVVVAIVSVVMAVFVFRRCKVSQRSYKPSTIETDCESLTHAESSLSSRCSSRKRDENEKLTEVGDTSGKEGDLESNNDGPLLHVDNGNDGFKFPPHSGDLGQSNYFDRSSSRRSSHHSVGTDDNICHKNTCTFSSFKSDFQTARSPPSLDRFTFSSRSARAAHSPIDEARLTRNCSEPRFRFDVMPTDDCFTNFDDSPSNRHLDLPLPPALPPFEHRGYTARSRTGSNCDIRSASSYAAARDARDNSSSCSFRQYRTLEPVSFNRDRYDDSFREDRTTFGRSNSMKQYSNITATGSCLYNVVSRPEGSYSDMYGNSDYGADAIEAIRVRESQSSSSSGGGGLYVRSVDNMSNTPEAAPKTANIVDDDGSINTFGMDFPPPPLDIIRESQYPDPLQSIPDSQDFQSRRPSAFTSASTGNERYGRKSSLKGINPTLPSKRAPTPSVRFRDELSKALKNPRPRELQLPNQQRCSEHSDDDDDSGCGGSTDVAVHSDRSSVSPSNPQNFSSSPALGKSSGVVLMV